MSEFKNSQRANYAILALDASTRENFLGKPLDQLTDDETQGAVQDLICDLMHYAHARGFEALAIADEAAHNFRVELEDDKEAAQAAKVESQAPAPAAPSAPQPVDHNAGLLEIHIATLDRPAGLEVILYPTEEAARIGLYQELKGEGTELEDDAELSEIMDELEDCFDTSLQRQWIDPAVMWGGTYTPAAPNAKKP